MRDTDSDWKILGDNDPYWGVLTNDDFRRENITLEHRERFYKTGFHDIANVEREIKKIGVQFPRKKALDFGCGVGRLVIPMAALAQEVVGLDVSDGMLTMAKQEIAARGISNARFVSNLEPDETFDWINSLIVFQHIPPERGILLFGDLISRVQKGGVISLHFIFSRNYHAVLPYLRQDALWRYDGQSIVRILSSKPSSVPAGKMMMFDYDLNSLASALITNGFERVTLQFRKDPTHHGAIIYGMKSA